MLNKQLQILNRLISLMMSQISSGLPMINPTLQYLESIPEKSKVVYKQSEDIFVISNVSLSLDSMKYLYTNFLKAYLNDIDPQI